MYDAVDWYVADFDIPANLPRTWLLTLGGESANDAIGHEARGTKWTRSWHACALLILKRFLLGTGRIPHPVGGAMGVTCVTAMKGDTPALKRLHHLIKYS